MSDLSSISQIESNVQFNDGGFSFVNTAGNMVVNHEFEKGFVQFRSGKLEDSRAYIWQVLSAVGDELGDVLYTNVRNYIQKVSDVDSCGVEQLKSLMQMLGFDYTIIERFDLYPTEVLNLMNILTVHRKYLMNDKLLKDTLMSSLYLDGSDEFGCYSKTISGEISSIDSQYLDHVVSNTQTYRDLSCFFGKRMSECSAEISHVYPQYWEKLSSYPLSDPSHDYAMDVGMKLEMYQNLSGFQNGQFDIDCRILRSGETISSDGFAEFARHLYSNLLLDFLTLRHGSCYYIIKEILEQDEADKDTSFKETYATSDQEVAAYGDNRWYKVQNGIRIDFDENGIADDINDGNDSLDNYSGNELVLLQEVLKKRDESFSGVKNSRYAYYRTRRVREYRDFMQSKYYVMQIQSQNNLEYRADPNYYVLSPSQIVLFNKERIGEIGDIDKLTPYQLLQRGVINGDIFNGVVDSLLNTTLYIIQLREKIKLQTRKNYMKGTNNLLLYVINEYLLNYSRHTGLSAIREYFKDHKPRLQDLKVVEYYDQTEYFNQETDYDGLSLSSGSTTNERFWKNNLTKEPQEVNKYNSFALNQIQEFYLSTLNLKGEYDKLSTSYKSISTELDYFNDFLDAVYGCGNVRTSLNEIGFINAQLERNGEWTGEMYHHLVRLSSNYLSFNEWVGEDYTYDTSSMVSNQISDVTENYIFVNLSDEYLSAVSAVYDKFIVSTDYLSDEIATLNTNYYDIISGDMEFYFVKPDPDVYPDCFDEETGEYKHDWYWQNEAWDGNLKYVYDKFSMLYTYCEDEDNIKNHPLIDTCEAISVSLESLSGDHYTTIVVPLSNYGYIDVEAEYFEDETDSTYNFCNDKISERTTYLTNLLNSLKEEAQSLRSDYTAIQTSVPGAISEYKNVTGLTSFWIVDFWVGLKSNPCGTGKDNKCPYRTGGGSLVQTNNLTAKVDGEVINTTYDPITKTRYYLKVNDNGIAEGKYHFEGSFTPGSLFNGREIDLDTTTQTAEKILSGMQEFITQKTRATYVPTYDTDNKFDGCNLEMEYRDYLDIGTGFAINQLISQLDDLKKSVSNLQNTIKDLYNLEDTSVIEDDNLYDTISAIITYLNDHGYEIFAKDSILKWFRQKLSEINKIKSQFKTIEDRYQSDILGNSKQSTYLAECTHGQELTHRNLSKILKYAATKDKNNRQSLLDTIQNNLDTYNNLQEFFSSMIDELSEYDTIPDSYVSGGLMLEDEIAKFVEFLINDVYFKIERQQLIIDAIKEKIFSYLDVIESEISDYLGMEYGFDSSVSDRIDEVYFYNKDSYLTQKELYLEYGGQNFCYYPYFNHKNLEHPSYQIHPFLWNFIETDSYTDRLCKQFYNIKIDDFESDRIAAVLSLYIGDFGNVIDEWKNGTMDFTGYTTRYEDSSHIQNQIWSEVVDFDGSFLPQAINCLCASYSQCLRSMELKKDGQIATKDQFLKKIKTQLSCTISSYTSDEVMNIVDGVVSSSTTYNANIKEEISNYLRTDGISATNNSALVGVIGNNMDETFYGRFYDHLGLTNHDIGVDADRIKEYWSAIQLITQDNDLSGVYDIYKYKRDVVDNSLILFKRYGKENPTYTERKNTLGELWVRQNNRPLAFPAFTGKNPVMCMNDIMYYHPTILRLVTLHNPISSIQEQLSVGLSSCRYFFDFTESNDGNYIGLVTYPTDKGKLSVSGSERVIVEDFNSNERIPANYENSMLINCYSETITDLDGNQRNIIYSAQNTIDRVDYIQSGFGRAERPHLSTETVSSDTHNYAYIGSYPRNTQDVYHIYADKIYLPSGGVILSNNIRICWMKGSSINNWFTDNSVINGQTGEDICFSYDSYNDTLTFAYLTESEEREYSVSGDIFYNGNAKEMNSHDQMDRNVKIVKTSNRGTSLKIRNDEQSPRELNTNADISYIPAYSDKTKPNDIIEQKLTNRYRSIELLGNSKDIDSKLQIVNNDVNQYLDYEDIQQNHRFGMVYEDYDSTVDKTLKIYKNPSIRNDLSSTEFIKWSQSLYNGYTKKDIDTLRVLVYNTDSLGKSTYYIGDFKSLINNRKWLNYDTETQNEISISGIPFDVTVNGLTLERYGNFTTNHINGISSIQMEILSTDSGMSSNMYFRLDDNEKPTEYAHVGEEKIRIIVFNTNDLDSFERHHLLDAYGVVYALSASQLIATQFKYGDGWVIISNPKDKNFKDELIRFYDDKYGRRKRFDEIHLSDYNNLSDVWLMQTSRRLQFKYREEDIFDLSTKNYYFPAINCRYPKSSGNYIDDYVITQYQQQEDTMAAYFNNQDIFIFDIVDSSECLENMGTVEIPSWDYNYDTRRVFEDYLSTTIMDDGRIVQNKDKYDVDDEESMMEYYHCFERGTFDNDEIFVKGQETYVNPIASHKISFSVGRDSIRDFEKFIRLYVNYRKTENQTIELFFNYFNYINTPFVELRDDGRVYSKVVDGSYLRLDSGDDGILDIYVQMKYMESKTLVGEKLIRIASYHIYNISDDKPKFTMDKTYSNSIGDQIITETSKISLNVSDLDIQMKKLGSNDYGYGKLTVGIDTTDNIQYPYTFDLEYPQTLITTEYDTMDDKTYSYQMNGTNVLVYVYKQTSTVTIPVKTTKTKQYMEKYLDQEFPCFIGENTINASEIKTVDGYVCLRS